MPRHSAIGRRVRTRSRATVDKFGNAIEQTALGCTEGCPDGVDEIITSRPRSGSTVG